MVQCSTEKNLEPIFCARILTLSGIIRLNLAKSLDFSEPQFSQPSSQQHRMEYIPWNSNSPLPINQLDQLLLTLHNDR